MSAILYGKIVYSCCAVGYSSCYENPGKQFFLFPNEKCLRDKRIVVMKWNNGDQSKYSKIYDDPFIPSKLLSIWFFSVFIYLFAAKRPARGSLHPDYVPSVFSHAIQVAKAPGSYYKLTVKRSAQHSQHKSSGTGMQYTAFQPPSIQSDEQELMIR